MSTENSVSDFFIDRTLYTTPPSPDSRIPKELRTYELLSQLSIPFSRVDHAPAATIEACHDIDQLLGVDICKNLFLCNAQKTVFYLLLLPGNKKFQTSILSKQIGSARLSFAPPEFMEQFLDITPGSVSVLGLMNDMQNHVQLLIDRELVQKHESIGCHPCINTTSLRIKTADILNKFLPHVKHNYIIVDLPFISS